MQQDNKLTIRKSTTSNNKKEKKTHFDELQEKLCGDSLKKLSPFFRPRKREAAGFFRVVCIQNKHKKSVQRTNGKQITIKYTIN